MDFADVQKHKTADDCWMVLGDTVYDLTAFRHEHPGGAQYITDEAGTDATAAFKAAHPLDIIERTITGQALKDAVKGKVDRSTVPKSVKAKKPSPSSFLASSSSSLTDSIKPPLDAIINIYDFEKVAQTEMLGNDKKEVSGCRGCCWWLLLLFVSRQGPYALHCWTHNFFIP